MTEAEADPDAIGPDGTVRLRCYLPMADSVWFSVGCDGQAGCGHVAPSSVRAAVRFMRSGEAKNRGARATSAVQPVRCQRMDSRRSGRSEPRISSSYRPEHCCLQPAPKSQSPAPSCCAWSSAVAIWPKPETSCSSPEATGRKSL